MQNRKRWPWIGGTPAIAAIRGGVLSQSDTRTVARRRMTSSGNRSQKLWGIISLKERWGLSWQGRLFVTSVDRKSTRLNSSHQIISYAVFCLKKKNSQQ